jgi:hypothetical protein
MIKRKERHLSSMSKAEVTALGEGEVFQVKLGTLLVY